jgi:hypothetical protein
VGITAARRNTTPSTGTRSHGGGGGGGGGAEALSAAQAAEAGGGVGTGGLVTRQPAAFFVAEHKLAIALPALRSLYGTAMACVQASLPTPLQQLRTPEVTGNFPCPRRRPGSLPPIVGYRWLVALLWAIRVVAQGSVADAATHRPSSGS